MPKLHVAKHACANRPCKGPAPPTPSQPCKGRAPPTPSQPLNCPSAQPRAASLCKRLCAQVVQQRDAATPVQCANSALSRQHPHARCPYRVNIQVVQTAPAMQNAQTSPPIQVAYAAPQTPQHCAQAHIVAALPMPYPAAAPAASTHSSILSGKQSASVGFGQTKAARCPHLNT
eukprot:366230-Chlamydomonas_euryale.AAC.15